MSLVFGKSTKSMHGICAHHKTCGRVLCSAYGFFFRVRGCSFQGLGFRDEGLDFRVSKVLGRTTKPMHGICAHHITCARVLCSAHGFFLMVGGWRF